MPGVRINAETAEAIAAGMPPCPNCGGRNVRPSQAILTEDKIRAWFRYAPYRCRACQCRFYYRHKQPRLEDVKVKGQAGG